MHFPHLSRQLKNVEQSLTEANDTQAHPISKSDDINATDSVNSKAAVISRDDNQVRQVQQQVIQVEIHVMQVQIQAKQV